MNEIGAQAGKGADSASSDVVGEETRKIRRVALFSFVLNLALAAMKGALAVLTGSLAVTASAIDSGTDCVASVALYAGLRLSTRKTPGFPLGLYKIENVISVVVAFFIFLAGYEIAREALRPASTAPSFSLWVVLLLAVATLATFLFGRYVLRVGKRTESPTLRAEGRHRQVDVLSSSLVLASVALSYIGVDVAFRGITLDQAAAVLVLVFIAHAGWQLLRDGMRVLLDASIDARTLMEIQSIIEEEPAVAEVKSLVGRNAGRFRFLQADLALRTEDLQKAYRISERVKKRIRERVPRVERITVHYEPRERSHARIAIPLADRSGGLSEHFGEAPYFALVNIHLSNRSIESQKVMKNPCLGVDKGKGICVAEWLVQQGVDEVLLKDEMKHRGPGYVFSDAGVPMKAVSAGDLREVLEIRLSPDFEAE